LVGMVRTKYRLWLPDPNFMNFKNVLMVVY